MANGSMTIEPLPGANFGCLIRFRGLLVVPGMGSINDQLELLVRLSNLFGPEVEDYHQTLT